MLQANDVSVEIKNKTILENVKFEVPAGKITALIGPNGSGKSTLMRAISSEISYQGKILINEQDINSMKAWELAAIRAVLPQNSSVAFPIAEALKIPRLLEACPEFPIIQPSGKDGFDFYYQPHFEKLFHYLNKKYTTTNNI